MNNEPLVLTIAEEQTEKSIDEGSELCAAAFGLEDRRWFLLERFGEGAFGTVYLSSDRRGRLLAIKMSKAPPLGNQMRPFYFRSLRREGRVAAASASALHRRTSPPMLPCGSLSSASLVLPPMAPIPLCVNRAREAEGTVSAAAEEKEEEVSFANGYVLFLPAVIGGIGLLASLADDKADGLSHHRLPIHECPSSHWRAFGAVGRQLVGAVSFLHHCGFAHGDIKPDNILVTDQHASSQSSKPIIEGGIHLLDFGSCVSSDSHCSLPTGAADTDGGGRGAAAFVMVNVFAGTMGFDAPEIPFAKAFEIAMVAATRRLEARDAAMEEEAAATTTDSSAFKTPPRPIDFARILAEDGEFDLNALAYVSPPYDGMAADWYAVGVTLFMCLTRNPYPPERNKEGNKEDQYAAFQWPSSVRSVLDVPITLSR